MEKTIAQLRLECENRGIPLNPDNFISKQDHEARLGKGKTPEGYKKYRKEDLIRYLGDYALKRMPTVGWGLQKRWDIFFLSACARFDELSEYEKNEIITSSDWYAETKHNGCRVLQCYHPDEGITHFSRHFSTVDFLPVNMTENILLQRDGKFYSPSAFKNVFKFSYILDCEIKARYNINTLLLNTTKKATKTKSELNATTAMLMYEPDVSKQLQITQSPLDIYVFDVLEFNGQNTRIHPLRTRLKILDQIYPYLRKMIDINLTDRCFDDKEEYYQSLVSAGGEGVVFKNLNSIYTTDEKRSKKVWVKRKRSMEESYGSDIDAFIIGFTPSDPKRGWAHYIGGVELGIYLRDKEGNVTEHHIGTVTGLTQEWREQMTDYDAQGNPILNKSFLDRVVTINGQSISPQSKRFSHCVFVNSEAPFRDDKSKYNCEIDEGFLLNNII